MNFLIAIVTLFLSPAMLCLYSLHAAIYAALFSCLPGIAALKPRMKRDGNGCATGARCERALERSAGRVRLRLFPRVHRISPSTGLGVCSLRGNEQRHANEIERRAGRTGRIIYGVGMHKLSTGKGNL